MKEETKKLLELLKRARPYVDDCIGHGPIQESKEAYLLTKEIDKVLENALYDVAKEVTLAHGLPYTDPRNGTTVSYKCPCHGYVYLDKGACQHDKEPEAKERARKIELLVDDQEKWAEDNMRACARESVRSQLQELSDEDLDYSLKMRGLNG